MNHYSTNKVPGACLRHINDEKVNQGNGHFDCWVGGTVVKVTKPPLKYKQNGGGIRGSVKGFSYASRRRLMRSIGKIDKEHLPIFVTLTYPMDWPENPDEWKRHLQNFIKRITYKFPGSAGVWKLEPQKRGAPHYHLLVWGVSYKDLRSCVPYNWYRVVGSGDPKHLLAGTRVEKVRTWRGVMSYASKYLGKEFENMPGWEHVGRYWGIFMRTNIPWSELVMLPCSYRDAVQIMRYLRRYAHLRGRDYRSLEVFVNNPVIWFDRLQ